jgi:hypothetical protein
MIEVDLTDGRVLTFQCEPCRTTHRGIANLCDGAVSRLRFDDYSGHQRLLGRFLIVDPGQPGLIRAVELSTGTETQSIDPGCKRQLCRQRQALRDTYGAGITFQTWLLSRNARSLRVWDVEPQGSPGPPRLYHLCHVSSRSSDANDAILAGSFPLDTDYLAQRADDWEERLRFLYSTIANWCRAIGPHVAIDEALTIAMNEDLMKRYAVPSRKLPVLRVRTSARNALTFKPHGLWVTGANGRIDVLARRGKHVVVDRAPVSQPSRWELFTPEKSRLQEHHFAEGIEFDEEAFGMLLHG